MNAVIDRPHAAEAQAALLSRGQGKGQGYRGFHPALDTRCETALAEHLTAAASGPAWERAADALLLAGRIISVHGMPSRHAAARQQLAGFLGVYDRFFHLPSPWQLSPATAPDSPLTWRTPRGDALVDVVRTAPPSHPLVDPALQSRVRAVAVWARESGLRLAGVRVLALSAPATSLLHNAATGFEPLAVTAFGGGLGASAGMTR